MSGRIMLTEQLIGNQKNILEVGHLTAGIYILSILSHNGMETAKVIISD
jgi:hypothetical protein